MTAEFKGRGEKRATPETSLKALLNQRTALQNLRVEQLRRAEKGLSGIEVTEDESERIAAYTRSMMAYVKETGDVLWMQALYETSDPQGNLTGVSSKEIAEKKEQLCAGLEAGSQSRQPSEDVQIVSTEGVLEGDTASTFQDRVEKLYLSYNLQCESARDARSQYEAHLRERRENDGEEAGDTDGVVSPLIRELRRGEALLADTKWADALANVSSATALFIWDAKDRAEATIDKEIREKDKRELTEASDRGPISTDATQNESALLEDILQEGSPSDEVAARVTELNRLVGSKDKKLHDLSEAYRDSGPFEETHEVVVDFIQTVRQQVGSATDRLWIDALLQHPSIKLPDIIEIWNKKTEEEEKSPFKR